MDYPLIEFLDDDPVEETMSSLEIAQLTSKMHKHVLESIRAMEPAWVKIAGTKFRLGTYQDKNNQSRPCYELTKRECLYVATKFNDEARAKLVLRWEELEKSSRKMEISLPDFTDPASAARAWAEQYEQRQIEAKRADVAEQQVFALSQEIVEMQPKVSYYDTILNNKSTVLITQIALDYGMSAKALNKQLFDMRIQHKVGDQWILYAPYITQGYVHSKPVEIDKKDGSKLIKYNTEWTQKGRLFLYNELKNVGILPLIER